MGDSAGSLWQTSDEKLITDLAALEKRMRQDYARMLAELKQDVVRLVAETTAAVAGRVLTPDDHRRLAEETARQLVAS